MMYYNGGLLLFILAIPYSVLTELDFTVYQNVTGPDGSTFSSSQNWTDLQTVAFIDLNADRYMDVLFLNKEGSEIYYFIQNGPKSSAHDVQSKPLPLMNPKFPDPIRSVASADFNGDSRVDLLLLTAKSETGPFNAYISFGLGGADRAKFNVPIFLNTFLAQPLICDLDGDMVADLYGEVEKGRIIHLGGQRFLNDTARYRGLPWSNLGYSAFADVNGDNIPDIVILVGDGNTRSLQVFLRQSSSLLAPDVSKSILIELEPRLRQASHLGLFVLGDFDSDGHMDLLIPACLTQSCLGSSVMFVYSFSKQKWLEVQLNLQPYGYEQNRGDFQFSFYPPDKLPMPSLALSSLVGPNANDVNLDGRLDVAMGLMIRSRSQVDTTAVSVLVNQGLDPTSGRLSFRAYLLPGVLTATQDRVRQIAFFDYGENGIMDILVVSTNSLNVPVSQLFVQTLERDPYFLKVMVLNGLCQSAEYCADKRLPYGMMVPGISLLLKTEAAKGGRQIMNVVLGGQSCCTALQLPFEAFGLDQYANYVDQLMVSIPPLETSVRLREIRFLVPKSQIVINPYPIDKPDQWSIKLFLQPLYDMKVVYIAITLLLLCILLIIVISILQCLEVRDDYLEKKKEIQRFHFDAM